MVDINSNPWRADFPTLAQTMNGKRVAFLDSGASAQKPQMVLDAVLSAYVDGYANIHRGLYDFSQRKTAAYESVRQKIATFMNVPASSSIVFTKNATEAINLVAQSWGRSFLKAGDEVILTEMEHHANIVPWHILQSQIGIVIKYIPITDSGALDLDEFSAMLNDNTKFISLTHVSNVLGTRNDVARVIALARAHNADIKILIDGSQGIVHGGVDIAVLDPDFYVWTGHKLYGPTGVGVLYGRPELLDMMPPYQGGGDMIETVAFIGSTFAQAPAKFEAGTPAIAEVIGMGAAIDYVTDIGMKKIEVWERDISTYANAALADIRGLKMFGTTPDKAGIFSFTLDGCPPADVAMILDQTGVAVRTGHHCCQPLMSRLGVTGTIRASCGLYTDKNDIDQLVVGLNKTQKLLG